jgi:hypothetical protein
LGLLPLKTACLLKGLNLTETLRLRLLRGIQLLYAHIALSLTNVSVLPGESRLRVCEGAVQRGNALLLLRGCLLAALLVLKRLLSELSAELGLGLLAALLILKRLLLCLLLVLKRLLSVARTKLGLGLLTTLCIFKSLLPRLVEVPNWA